MTDNLTGGFIPFFVVRYREKLKRNLWSLFYSLLLTQNLGEMDSIYCVHKNKKKSIAFIY